MTKEELEILQNLRIINLILNDIAEKVGTDDFFCHRHYGDRG